MLGGERGFHSCKTKKEELTRQLVKRATSDDYAYKTLIGMSPQSSLMDSKNTAWAKLGRVEVRSSEMMMALWLIWTQERKDLGFEKRMSARRLQTTRLHEQLLCIGYIPEFLESRCPLAMDHKRRMSKTAPDG